MKLSARQRNCMGLSKMLNELWLNLQHLFRPYSLEDFINDYQPKDHQDLERAERLWQQHKDQNFWN